MANFLHRFINRSKFVKHTLTLISGTVVAQAFSLVSMIILQRYFFSPDDFGVLTVFTSYCSVFIAASTFKYDYAIVMAKKDEAALNLAVLSFACVILVSVASFFVLIFSQKLLSNLPASEVSFFIVMVPAMVLFGGSYDIFNFWNNRGGAYKEISYGRITQNVTTELTRFSLVPFNINSKALITGRVIGYLASLVFLSRSFFKMLAQRRDKITWRAMLDLARLNKDFPLFTMPTIIVNNFTTWLFVFLFYEYYGSSVTGLVSVAIQYVALPFGILATAFSQVFYKKITDIESRQVLLTLYKKFSTRLCVLGLLVVLIVFATPEELVVWILGEDWRGVSAFMRTAVVWQTIAFVSSSLSFIYTRLLKQRLMIFFALLQLLLVYLSLQFGNQYLESSAETFVIFVSAQSAYYVLTIFSAYYFINKSRILK